MTRRAQDRDEIGGVVDVIEGIADQIASADEAQSTVLLSKELTATA
nr:hypothetical protein [Pseudomonas sp. 2FG]